MAEMTPDWLTPEDRASLVVAAQNPGDPLRFVHEQVVKHIRAAVQADREQSCRDVCMYCGGRAPGFKPAEGPNDAGNWTHEKDNRQVLCAATGIRARDRFVRQQDPPSG